MRPPELELHLTQMVNRYAKMPHLSHADRAALYRLKGRRISEHVQAGLIRPTCVLIGRWRSMDGMTYGIAEEALEYTRAVDTEFDSPLHLLSEFFAAAWEAEQLERPLTPEQQQRFRVLLLSDEDVDPLSGYLVGFGTPQEPEMFHQPYREVPPPLIEGLPRRPREPGYYGRPPTREEREQWPLLHLLIALDEDPYSFPNGFGLPRRPNGQFVALSCPLEDGEDGGPW